MKVCVVGAGPSGTTIAKELAAQGHKVDVFEEHKTVGRPIACTGLVTKALFSFVKKDEQYIINEMQSVKVISPSENEVDIPLHEYVICREKFDNFLREQAEAQGVTYHTRHKFTSAKNNTAFFDNVGNSVEKKYDMLIGADGPFSAVGRAFDMLGERKYYVGSQATITGNFDAQTFYTFFGQKAAPGFFAWAVPEDEKKARVGVATQKHVHTYFELLRKKFNGEITERQAGPIPIYDGAKCVQKGNVYLVGDAAGVCKNTTGGGIITGIWSANVLADALKQNKDYSRALNPLRRELWLHQKLRNTLDRFSDNNYETLVSLMRSARVKSILNTYPREFPSRFLWKLLLAEPRLGVLGFKAIGF